VIQNLGDLISCAAPCTCEDPILESRLIAITGGPGAGKTTFLSLAKRIYCRHVAILPEAASILYAGGFPRSREPDVIKAAQRAVWYVMRELEQLAIQRQCYHVILCDRGSLDGPAYWPESEESFFQDLKTTPEQEVKRYHKVLHLQTPDEAAYQGLGTRTENVREALAIDHKTRTSWKRHPNQQVIESTHDFYHKMNEVRRAIECELPTCCQENLAHIKDSHTGET